MCANNIVRGKLSVPQDLQRVASWALLPAQTRAKAPPFSSETLLPARPFVPSFPSLELRVEFSDLRLLRTMREADDFCAVMHLTSSSTPVRSPPSALVARASLTLPTWRLPTDGLLLRLAATRKTLLETKWTSCEAEVQPFNFEA